MSLSPLKFPRSIRSLPLPPSIRSLPLSPTMQSCPFPPVQDVVAGAAPDPVVAVAALEMVCARIAVQPVAEIAAGDVLDREEKIRVRARPREAVLEVGNDGACEIGVDRSVFAVAGKDEIASCPTLDVVIPAFREDEVARRRSIEKLGDIAPVDSAHFKPPRPPQDTCILERGAFGRNSMVTDW